MARPPERACRLVDRVGVGDVELDADLRHRPLYRPFRCSEARLGGLRERPDSEGPAARELLVAEVLVAAERQTERVEVQLPAGRSTFTRS